MLNINIFSAGYYLTEYSRINIISYNVVIDPADSAVFLASIKKKKKWKDFIQIQECIEKMSRLWLKPIIEMQFENLLYPTRADFVLNYIEMSPLKSMYQTSRYRLEDICHWAV